MVVKSSRAKQGISGIIFACARSASQDLLLYMEFRVLFNTSQNQSVDTATIRRFGQLQKGQGNAILFRSTNN